MLEIIPAVDVLGGKVVRLMHGDYDQVTVYSDDPVRACGGWIEQGATRVHVVDLDGARTGSPDTALWESLVDAGIRFQLGGGIRTARVADQALSVGADRVVLGTAAVWDPQILADISDLARVVAAVDVRHGQATGAGWLDDGRPLQDVLGDLARAGVQRLLVTGIEKDGTMEGPAVELLGTVVDRGDFAVIASGGVGQLSDLDALVSLGAEGVIVGRALYEGRFDVVDAIAHLSP